jgi:protease-4
MSAQESGGKSPRGCRFGCLALLAAAAVVALLLAAAVVYVLRIPGLSPGFGRTFATFGGTALGEDECPVLSEVWSSGRGEVKVVRIPLTGFIFLDDPGAVSEPGSAEAALRAIRRATHDEAVEGILLEIDSGGGGITASDVLYKALLDFKAADDGRVIVALLGDVAASGAYYVALAADVVVAHPTSLTGSIGVIVQSYNIRELARKLGIEDVTIKSGANKDLLNPFRELSPEQRDMLQKLVDGLHRRFVRLVAESRSIEEEDVRKLADGRIFLADEAMDLRLVDALGYTADAERTVADLLKVDAVHVVRYEEERSLFDLLRVRRGGFGLRLRNLLNEHETRLLYQWSP